MPKIDLLWRHYLSDKIDCIMNFYERFFVSDFSSLIFYCFKHSKKSLGLFVYGKVGQRIRKNFAFPSWIIENKIFKSIKGSKLIGISRKVPTPKFIHINYTVALTICGPTVLRKQAKNRFFFSNFIKHCNIESRHANAVDAAHSAECGRGRGLQSFRVRVHLKYMDW